MLTQQSDRKSFPAYDVCHIGPNKRFKIGRTLDLEGPLMVLVLRDASVGHVNPILQRSVGGLGEGSVIDPFGVRFCSYVRP